MYMYIHVATFCIIHVPGTCYSVWVAGVHFTQPHDIIHTLFAVHKFSEQ